MILKTVTKPMRMHIQHVCISKRVLVDTEFAELRQ